MCDSLTEHIATSAIGKLRINRGASSSYDWGLPGLQCCRGEGSSDEGPGHLGGPPGHEGRDEEWGRCESFWDLLCALCSILTSQSGGKWGNRVLRYEIFRPGMPASGLFGCASSSFVSACSSHLVVHCFALFFRMYLNASEPTCVLANFLHDWGCGIIVRPAVPHLCTEVFSKGLKSLESRSRDVQG